MKQLSFGCSVSMRASTAFVTSTGETCRLAIIPRRDSPVSCQSSEVMSGRSRRVEEMRGFQEPCQADRLGQADRGDVVVVHLIARRQMARAELSECRAHDAGGMAAAARL